MTRGRLAIAMLVVAGLAAGCSAGLGSSGSPAAAQTIQPIGAAQPPSQSVEAGGITLTATWQDIGRSLTFEVKLDNHMIDLDGVTLATASLRNDRGAALSAERWTASAGGHHRDGTLTFQGDQAAFLAGTSWVELTLPPIGSVSLPAIRWTTRTAP